jgi:threonine dehydrogenase-like Zn-dependent dehydrogenase
VGHHADKLAILQRLGIVTRRASQGLEMQVDVVVDCTGNREGFECARRMVKPRGTLVLKSTFKGQNEVDLTSLVVDEISLVGSRCGPFGPALRLLGMGLVDVKSLITAVYSLDQALDAVERARERRSLKVLLRP